MGSAVADGPGRPPEPSYALRVAAVAVVAVAVDQLTKHLALNGLDDGPIHLIGTLDLRLTFNEGTAFGLGVGLAPFLALGALVLLVMLVRQGSLVDRPVAAVAVGSVLGGAVGNLVDRALREGEGFLGGAVVDFIDIGPWPVFNVADMAIVIGGVVLVWSGRDMADPDADPGEPETAEAR